ncbi:hypothetical protein SNEBB_008173 [Seison nebaliae]|nr:hypothetical protein SNEBB_008173 [Seison nebaliae]
MIPSSSSNYVKKGRSLRPDFADEILFNKEMTQELLQAPTFHPSSGFREQPYDIPYLKRMNRRKTNSFNAIPQYHNRSQQLHTSQIYTDPAPMQYRQKKHHTFAQLHPNEYQSNNFENLPVFDKSNYRPNKYQNNFVPEQKIIPTDSSRRINARNYANQSNVLNFSKRRIKKKLEKNVKELSKHNIASRSALFSTSNKNNQSRTNLFVFPNSIAEPVPNYFNEDPSFQRTLSSSTDIDDYVAELNDKFPTSTNRSHSATSSHHPDSSYNHKTMNDNVSTDIQYSKDQQQQQQQQYNHKNSSSNSTPHYYNYHQSDNSRHHQQQQQQMSQPKPKQKQKQLSQDNYYETTYSSSSEKSKNDKNEVNSEEIRDDIGYKPHGPKVKNFKDGN